jgi:hypothetical protein
MRRGMELGDKIKVALDETRILVLGVQILLGFACRSVFEEEYAKLPATSRLLDGAALLLLVLTLGLLITPDPYHRVVTAGNDTGGFHRLVTRVADLALLPFALSLGLAVFVAGERLFGIAGAVAVGLAFTLLALLAWYGLGWLRRRRAGHEERARTARQIDMSEKTSLHQRINQMLTEARVILPGAQALLGFQLAIVMTRPFAELPGASKLVHAASLGAIAVAVILLMAPAAYHRIVFAGEDTEEMHRTGSRFVAAATVPLALGLAGDVYVVLAKTAESPAVGLAAAAAVLVLLVGLWHVLPLVARQRRHETAADDAARSGGSAW